MASADTLEGVSEPSTEQHGLGDKKIKPYAEVFIPVTDATALQQSSPQQPNNDLNSENSTLLTTDGQPELETEVQDSDQQSGIHTDTVNHQATATAADTLQSTVVADDAQQVEADVGNSSSEVLTSATADQPEPDSSALKVNPYAEIAIVSTTARPNSTTMDSIAGIMTGSNPNAPISAESTTAQSEPDVVEGTARQYDINPYAEITLQFPPEIASSAPPHCGGNEPHCTDPTELNSRRMSLDPQIVQAPATTANDENTLTAVKEEGFSERISNPSRRRLSLGARMFLRSTTVSGGARGSVSRTGVGRRRLTLGLRHFQRATTEAESNDEKNTSVDKADLLANLRSSGVSFPTGNPKLRKKVVEEVEQHRSDSAGSRTRRRAMTVGAQFFHRPLATTRDDRLQSSTDDTDGSGSRRSRRMTIGARFLHRITTSDGKQASEASTSEPHIRRRGSLAARLFQSRHSSMSRRGTLRSLGTRFRNQFSAIPEDNVSSHSREGETQQEESCSEPESRSRRLNFGARLLQRLTAHQESSAPTSNEQNDEVPLTTNEGSIQSCSDETASYTSSLDQSPAEILDTLRSSGIYFPTNRILQSRARKEKAALRSLRVHSSDDLPTLTSRQI